MKKMPVTTLLLLLAMAAVGMAKRNALLEIPEVARDQVICFALYTVQNNVMKMTAQLYPLQKDEAREVRLEIKRNGRWRQIARSPVIERGWTALFRVENWDTTRDIEYRLRHG